ncbi:N-acetyltransferase [Phytoactinopolyspora endophytica]|uniref:N-acetyltransferase n=1 Tax=Phytoactinopolyspora endophytica TaxID=1642495 RepID=UPI00101D9064|nr:N-acetyltransferase [Phytoactinopolyspora endophytica]
MRDDLVIDPLDKRPDLAPMVWQLSYVWPTYMTQDPVSHFYFTTVERDHPEHVLVAYEAARPDVPVARAFTVPFEFGTAQRSSLPDDGWDAVIRWGALDLSLGRTPTHVSALEIAIRPERRGEGLAAVLLAAMRDNVQRLGFTELFAPVRPTGKANELHTPMSEYAFRTRDDGLPADPWLRVHVRAGGEIVRVCPRAMVISGSLVEWREWTGLPFDRTGDVEVPGALVPIHCSVEHDHAVYVEPGVWVRHRLS